ncbi:MAG: RelA/SpoT domain-containing protein [Desulfuromonadales bacterium]|nr:RelA/SpoT domain-containing protein [Desulfuromonadales bacterium]
MASLDFEKEKRIFRAFYDSHSALFDKVLKDYIQIISTLLQDEAVGEVTKIEGRVKDREECIKKFHRKYQNRLESDEKPYRIKDYLSDLIGIRIICLYEDQIELVSAVLKKHFTIIDVTDKISAVENTEASFGYKGLHMDISLTPEMTCQSKYQACADYPFEVQIRSLIQDAWSVLDHKIKYKKSIPNALKRRINLLSALFELADREFKEIRNATMELIQQATVAPISDTLEESGTTSGQPTTAVTEKAVNAFNFLRIASHFFRDFEFEDYKVDDFVQNILKIDSGFQKSALHKSLIENFKTVRDYRDNFIAENPESTFSPYTSIRHCLYLYNKDKFSRILSKGPKERFEAWLKEVKNTLD